MKFIGCFLVVWFAFVPFSEAQEDLLNQLEESTPASEAEISTAAFKGTRIINGHSVELRDQKVFDFIISHRFGRLNSGPYEFFGLDEANVRIGFDYGLLPRLNVGLGRNSFEKTFDGFLKYKILSQTKGAKSVPLSAVVFSSLALNSLKNPFNELPFSSRFSYTWQLLVARKFNEGLSIQISPGLVHRNLVKNEEIDNDIFVIGIGGRQKVSKRISINAEYFYQINQPDQPENYNSISLGVDIETGGHVFQLHVSNSRAMNEKGFITETTGNFFKGDIHLGFNISRVFQF